LGVWGRRGKGDGGEGAEVDLPAGGVLAMGVVGVRRDGRWVVTL